MTDDQTTITVTKSTLERFNRLKEEQSEDGIPEMNADLFLQSLMDTLEHAENGGYSDDIEQVLAEYDGRLTYDDVVNATRKAIRQELPDGALQ